MGSDLQPRPANASPSTPDKSLVRALARAHRWKRMLEAGTHRSAAEIAEVERIDRSFVNRLLRLTLLEPDIQEAILDGRQPKGMKLEELMKTMPSEWEQQREQFAGKTTPSGSTRAQGARLCAPRVRTGVPPRPKLG